MTRLFSDIEYAVMNAAVYFGLFFFAYGIGNILFNGNSPNAGFFFAGVILLSSIIGTLRLTSEVGTQHRE